MKTKGSVFQKHGLYLKYTESTTHTGTHRKMEWVDDINLATVFFYPPARYFKDELNDSSRLDVVIKRTVKLAKKTSQKEEIGDDPEHVDHLTPEELASDRAMIGEMLKEHGG